MKRISCHALRGALLICIAFILVALTASYTNFAQQPSNAGAQTSQQRPDTDAVMLTVTVMDRHRNYVAGLNQNNFAIYDNKQNQEIIYFNAEDAAVSVGILVDVSDSMSESRINNNIREVLSRFIQLSNKSNEYFLIGFNKRPQLMQDWTRDGASILNNLPSAKREQKSGGTTALYDACYLGIEKVAQGKHSKRALLLITDGQDSESHYQYKELRRVLEDSDVPVYAIGIIGFQDSFEGIQGRAVLDGLTSISGGVLFLPESAEQMNAAFEVIAIELRNQYRIGFKPANSTGNGKRHSIKVKVTPPPNAPPELQRLSVRSRESYYTIKNSR